MSQNNAAAELIADIKEQVLYLQELGVKDMDVDLSVLEPAMDISGKANVSPSVPPRVLETVAKTAPPKGPERPAGSRLASLPSLKDIAPKNAPGPADQIEVVSEHADIMETIPEIRAEIGPDCTRCKLCQLGRAKVVNSVGNFNADLMFVGEAPGADEDEQGEPFVGRAGRLLTDIMKAIGFEREDVFIGNINRCRPPKNRAPEPDETVVCKPFLLREIAVVRPKVIVVLGATAAQNLLETKVPIGRLRGHFHEYRGTKVMPTFHPAYLLRDPNKKREVWDDMKMVRDYLKTCS
jgi:uracil-DNA glycosylase family 4